MEKAARRICGAGLTLALLGLVATAHPVTGFIWLVLRWPLFVLVAAMGAWSFGRSRWVLVGAALVTLALIFAPALTHLMTRAAVQEPEHQNAGRGRLRVITYHLDETATEGSDMALSLEALRAEPAELILLQGVSSRWLPVMEKDALVSGMHRVRHAANGGGFMVLAHEVLRNPTPVMDADGVTVGVCAQLASTMGALLACSAALSPPPVFDSAWETAQHYSLSARRRARQWAALVAHADKEGLPNTVVGVDVAGTDWEPNQLLMERDMVDAFRSQSMAPGGTWPAVTPSRSWVPIRRDRVFAKGDLRASDGQVLALTGSRHHPLHVTLER